MFELVGFKYSSELQDQSNAWVTEFPMCIDDFVFLRIH